jgi:hypothetical protein
MPMPMESMVGGRRTRLGKNHVTLSSSHRIACA